MCVCCYPIYSGRQACGRTSREVTQEEGNTGFLHLPSAGLALIFIARRIQPSLSLIDREVVFFVYPRVNCPPLFFFVTENPTSCDCTEIRTHVPTSDVFEVTI